jgi:hypothetical protein
VMTGSEICHRLDNSDQPCFLFLPFDGL